LYIFKFENDDSKLKVEILFYYYAYELLYNDVNLYNICTIDYETRCDIRSAIDQLLNETGNHDTCNESPSSETTEEIAVEQMLTSSQVNSIPFCFKHEFVEHLVIDVIISFISLHSLGEVDTTIKPSHGNNNVI